MCDNSISLLRQRMIEDMTAVQGEVSEGLRPAREDLLGVPRPFSGYGDERGPSPLSTAHGPATDRRADHQFRHRRVAVLLHRDARTARPRSSSAARERAAKGAGRAESGGGGASPPGRAGPQVQGRASSRHEGLLLRASHRTGHAGLASGSLDRYLRAPARAGPKPAVG